MNNVEDILKSKLPIEIQHKDVKLKAVYDYRTFEPCQAKEIEMWSWIKLRNKKYLGHVDYDGNFSIKEIS